jgi:hypothetical protein
MSAAVSCPFAGHPADPRVHKYGEWMTAIPADPKQLVKDISIHVPACKAISCRAYCKASIRDGRKAVSGTHLFKAKSAPIHPIWPWLRDALCSAGHLQVHSSLAITPRFTRFAYLSHISFSALAPSDAVSRCHMGSSRAAPDVGPRALTAPQRLQIAARHLATPGCVPRAYGSSRKIPIHTL